MKTRKTNNNPASCRAIIFNLEPGQSHCFDAREQKQSYVRWVSTDISRDYNRSYSVNMKGTEIKVTRNY